MTEPTAVTALIQRRQQLVGKARHNENERDRHQQAADRFQKIVTESLAEIDSIDNALELLSAAIEFAVNQPPSKEEPDA